MEAPRRGFSGSAAPIRQAAWVGIEGGAAFSATGLDLLTLTRFLIAGRHIARIGGETSAARIPAIDNGGSAGAVRVACVRVAGKPVLATGVRRAVGGTRAVAVRTADILRAGVVVAAIPIAGHAVSLHAVETADTFVVVIRADIVLACLAAGAFVVGAAARFWNTRIPGAAFWCGAFAACAGAVGHRAAGGVAASFGAAALVVIRTATFILGFAEDQRVFAAELFTVAMAEATGVIATLAVRSADPRGIAAVGSALAGGARRTGALAALQGLLTRTGDRLRGGRRTAGRLRAGFQHGAADCGGTAQAEQPFQHRAATLGLGKRLRQRIKTTIVHSQTSLSLFGEVNRCDSVLAGNNAGMLLQFSLLSLDCIVCILKD